MFGDIAKPLIRLMKQNCDETWGSNQDAVFKSLKQSLVQAPVLIIPKPGPYAHFLLATDASSSGIGAVLLQDQS